MKKGIIILVCFTLFFVSCAPEEKRMIDPAKVTIGYIGCSNTRETVEGYHYTGGMKMWPYERRYGSGTVRDWANDVEEGSVYWEVFDGLMEEYPKTKTIWWELCIMDEDRATSYEQANTVLKEIRERIPDAVIYVSPLPPYTEGVCEITGTFGLEKAKELARELDDKNQDVFAGPILGPMTQADTANDGCHLSSPDGKRKLGNQMRLFFDANEYSADEASIGYVGCSNTMQTVASYDLAGGRRLWTFHEDELHEYDDGAVVDWSKGAEQGNKFWKTFDRYLENSPNTKAIFWQLCIREEELTSYEEAIPILEAIRQKVSGAIIYVSPLPPYTEGVCEITGTAGIELAKTLVEELDLRNDDVIAGPVLGPMTPADTAKDGCHLSEQGLKTLGQQMQKFFDAQQNRNESKVSSGAENSTIEDDIPALSEVLPSPEEESVSPEEQVWRRRIEAAMESTPCPDIPPSEFTATYYQGPLTDTHLHIPDIPDWSPEEDDLLQDQAPEGRFGGPQALLGWNVKMSEIACTIKQEGTHKNFAFFPAYEEEISLLEIWNRTMHTYPNQFTPFIMSAGDDDEPNGFSTVDAQTLREMLAAYPKLFQGYGEIGLYARENGGAPELPPDAKRLQDIYPIIREHNLVIYFHLGEGHKDNFEKVLQQYPDITFIWHGDQLSVDEIDDILENYPNAYYGVDAFWGHDQDTFHLFVGESKEAYLNKMAAEFDRVLNYAVADWKSVIERHPDQMIWGIDRGDAVWNYDLDVGQMQVKLARAFIGKLKPEVQEKFAYKNAQQLINGE